MTHKKMCVKVLEAWSRNHFSVAPEYYTDDEIVKYVRSLKEMSKAELLSELLQWEQ